MCQQQPRWGILPIRQLADTRPLVCGFAPIFMNNNNTFGISACVYKKFIYNGIPSSAFVFKHIFSNKYIYTYHFITMQYRYTCFRTTVLKFHIYTSSNQSDILILPLCQRSSYPMLNISLIQVQSPIVKFSISFVLFIEFFLFLAF